MGIHIIGEVHDSEEALAFRKKAREEAAAGNILLGMEGDKLRGIDDLDIHHFSILVACFGMSKKFNADKYYINAFVKLFVEWNDIPNEVKRNMDSIYENESPANQNYLNELKRLCLENEEHYSAPLYDNSFIPENELAQFFRQNKAQIYGILTHIIQAYKIYLATQTSYKDLNELTDEELNNYLEGRTNYDYNLYLEDLREIGFKRLIENLTQRGQETEKEVFIIMGAKHAMHFEQDDEFLKMNSPVEFYHPVAEQFDEIVEALVKIQTKTQNKERQLRGKTPDNESLFQEIAQLQNEFQTKKAEFARLFGTLNNQIHTFFQSPKIQNSMSNLDKAVLTEQICPCGS